MTSIDGIKWINKSAPSLGGGAEIMWNGSRFINVGSGIFTSIDGIEWSDKNIPNSSVIALSDIAWSGELYIATSRYRLLTSSDGDNWEIYEFGTNPNTIAWTGTKFVAVKNGIEAYSTKDGISWYDRIRLPGRGNKKRVLFDDNNTDKSRGSQGTIRWTGNELIFVYRTYIGQPNIYGSYICTSPDGIMWTIQSDSIEGDPNDIAWNDDVFVVVGARGTILTSPRGNTNSKPKTTTQNPYFEITLTIIGTRLRVILPSSYSDKNMSITIYNISGKKVFSRNSFAIDNTIEYDLAGVPSGYYTFVAKSKEFEVKNKFLLTR